MKHFWLFLAGILMVASAGQVRGEPQKVREESFLIQKEIQVWRNNVTLSQTPVYHCQAVQLNDHWFLTAAHCVYTACSGTHSCTVQVTLAQNDLRKRVRIYHNNNTPRVTIYPGFFPGQNRISRVDVALVHLVPKDADYLYDMWTGTSWEQVSPMVFEEQLKLSPETQAQLATREVRLVSSVNLPNSLFLQPLVVPKMESGILSYLISDSPQVYFVSSLQHFIASDFGVRRGNSGGGVFTKDGDLVGLVSSLFFTRDGSASFQDDEGKTLLTLHHAQDYFLFTGFNGDTLNFIRNKMSYLRTIGAENGFTEPTEKDFKSIVGSLQETPMQF